MTKNLPRHRGLSVCSLVNMMLQKKVSSECVLKLAPILQVTDMARRSQGMALGAKGGSRFDIRQKCEKASPIIYVLIENRLL